LEGQGRAKPLRNKGKKLFEGEQGRRAGGRKKRGSVAAGGGDLGSQKKRCYLLADKKKHDAGLGAGGGRWEGGAGRRARTKRAKDKAPKKKTKIVHGQDKTDGGPKTTTFSIKSNQSGATPGQGVKEKGSRKHLRSGDKKGGMCGNLGPAGGRRTGGATALGVKRGGEAPRTRKPATCRSVVKWAQKIPGVPGRSRSGSTRLQVEKGKRPFPCSTRGPDRQETNNKKGATREGLQTFEE